MPTPPENLLFVEQASCLLLGIRYIAIVTIPRSATNQFIGYIKQG